jgi:hypothetical protein
MSNNESVMIVAIIAGSIGLAVVIVLLIFVLMRGLVSKAKARVAAQIPAEAIVMVDWVANNFGVQSLGVTQLRGNGALVLTKDTLHFFMLVGQRELKIPLASITGISFVNRHLGKTVGRKLLAVDFNNEAGAADRVAWYVRELDAWQQRLREHTKATG